MSGSARALTNIQALRALAALLVALFHVLETAKGYGFGAGSLRPLEGWGSVGVDLFFVISGFIMVHVQASRPASPAQFLRNRLIRILPLYWTLTLGLCALFLLVPAAFNTRELAPAWVVASLAFASQAMLGRYPVLFDGWTLEYEMAFYVLFAASLSLGTPRRAMLLCCAMLGLWAALAAGPLVLEFAFGMVAGILFLRGAAGRLAPGVIATAALILFLCLAPRLPADVHRAWILGPVCAVLVLASAQAAQQRLAWLTRTGDASYAIYLIQVFTVPAYYKAASLWAPGLSHEAHALACLGLTVLAGHLVYRFLESPLAIALAPLRERPRR